ncbi:MAG TPA: uroporphyrinogen decarboxylase family protein [Planctomycetota bacterium]|nr:uroporphyrinogen decarboxylase family protein [Planctomycetota bacterium]HRR80932.1 uroporphyrinogen decarboxylase family protein [Planctomycetota bacterium]
MSAQDDRVKAMKFQHPEYIPVGVGILPAAWKRHREKLDRILARHPAIFGEVKVGERDYDKVGGLYVQGRHVDPWGYVWENVCEGMDAYPAVHNVPTRADVHRLKAPEVHDGMPHGFMYMRLFYLRGFEELMLDFAEEPPELQMLIDIVLDYNVRELEYKIEQMGPGEKFVYFGDDLGMQHALPMGPYKWRKYLKPCFMKLYRRCKEVGWWVYMHTDGHCWEIIPDLKECGVDVINPQFRANGLDNLVLTCKGNICVNLDLDRQMMPFVGPAELDAHIRECVSRLGTPEGGLWITAEIGPDVPLENVEAICAALEKYRAYFR